MKGHIILGILCIPYVVACSDKNSSTVADATDQSTPSTVAKVTPTVSKTTEDNTKPGYESVADDCPGFSQLFAKLPDRIIGEEVEEDEVNGESYFSCDAVSPRAEASFTSEVQGNFWQLSVTSKNIDIEPGKGRWDFPNASDEQKARLKKGIQAAVDAEILLFNNCVNTLNIEGLPEWHLTHRTTFEQYDICIGTDAQRIEDAGWTARAMSSEYIYTLKFEGDKATQFTNAQATENYVTLMFRQFR